MEKEVYTSPTFYEFGDITEVTLGAKSGANDLPASGGLNLID